MQLHSSIVPVGLPLGLATGALTYHLCTSMGALPHHAVVIAQWVGVSMNAVGGAAKNVVTLDFASLVLARPVSGFLTWCLLGAMLSPSM